VVDITDPLDIHRRDIRLVAMDSLAMDNLAMCNPVTDSRLMVNLDTHSLDTCPHRDIILLPDLVMLPVMRLVTHNQSSSRRAMD
jgi:hypothetical protein